MDMGKDYPVCSTDSSLLYEGSVDNFNAHILRGEAFIFALVCPSVSLKIF